MWNKYTIVFNLGCKGHGVVSYYPNVWKNIKLSEFRKQKHIKDLFKFCKNSHIVPSYLSLIIVIENKKFTINCMNIREYRKFWEIKYNK